MVNVVTSYESGKTVTLEYTLIFLLTQDDKILGGSADITTLSFEGLDPAKSWKIVAGTECYGIRRVLGPVVQFIAVPGSKFYRLSSEMDGYNRLVGKVGNSVDVALSRITPIAGTNGFDDHANLSKILILECSV